MTQLVFIKERLKEKEEWKEKKLELTRKGADEFELQIAKLVFYKELLSKEKPGEERKRIKKQVNELKRRRREIGDLLKLIM